MVSPCLQGPEDEVSPLLVAKTRSSDRFPYLAPGIASIGALSWRLAISGIQLTPSTYYVEVSL